MKAGSRWRYFIAIIIGMPFIIIIIGMPMDIIEFMASQASRIMSIDMPSMGMHFIIRPSLPISQVMRAIIIGRIIMGIGIIIGMPFIMPIMGFMPFIMGMPIIGICPIMPFIICMGFIMPFIIGFIMGICMAAFIVRVSSRERARAVV
ncbi:MAG: hypothetical protein INH41_24830 [Myxococcaceae bacterium]|nr:hypothetical protein [Myxococcaceae bacterium]